VVSCTAFDDALNEGRCTFSITVEDLPNPILICPPDSVIGCDESADPGVTGTPDWFGFCDAPVISYEDAVPPGDLDGDCDVDRDDVTRLLTRRNERATGVDDPYDIDGDGWITVLDARRLTLLFRNGTTMTRTWTAVDGCGLVGTCVQLITRIDPESRAALAAPRGGLVPPVAIVRVAPSTEPGLRFELEGTPRAMCTVQVSVDLEVWMDLPPVRLDPSGRLIITEPEARGTDRLYFRVRASD